MLLLGIDIGTSFIKVAVVDAETGCVLASVVSMNNEAKIISKFPGGAEQCPEQWWEYVRQTIQHANALKKYNPRDIAAIGIAYQMHGLVLVDKDQCLLRDAIIWCDSRAVETGEEAYAAIGADACRSALLNSPGNFTASKLAWVKKNEPGIYSQVDKVMLPGDFIAMKLTGKITTTSSALSEGILWDFEKEEISAGALDYFQFDKELFPELNEVFSLHGFLKREVAAELGMAAGTPVTYKAGDQLNNALSLNVLHPGQAAATAGTSGVIFAVTDKLLADKSFRVNAFAHVNHRADEKRLGVLLCINGAGIMYNWVKKMVAPGASYEWMNDAAFKTDPGSDGLCILPFGNGAERMLENKIIGSHFAGLDLNRHSAGHICRAAQEGIAFAFRYGLDILKENGIAPTIIRAGRSNLFLSDVFIRSFVNATGISVELYPNDGSAGAATGAGIGAGIYSFDTAFTNLTPLQKIEPTDPGLYDGIYHSWKENLLHFINQN